MTKIFKPLVSIIIPVYNGSNYLKQAINSAISQTYDNVEIIVVNDGSNDNNKTENIAKSYGEKIRYFKKENGGVASALNLGIEKMNGEYFSWLSHDDIYTSGKISSQIKTLSKLTSKTSILFSNYSIIDEKGKKNAENILEINGRIKEKGLIELFNFQINGCALLIHKTFFDKFGNFNVNLPTTQDYDFWFKILKEKDIYFVNVEGVLSRKHNQQTSKRYLVDHLKECDELWIRIINSIEPDIIKKNWGSELKFFEFAYRQLSAKTNYYEATLYARNKLINSILDLNNNEFDSFEKETNFLKFDIVQCNQKNESLITENTELNKRIKTIDSENKVLNDRIKTIDSENKVLNDRIKTIDSENKNLIKNINLKENKILDLDKKVNDITELLSAKTFELENIYRSKTWKIKSIVDKLNWRKKR